MARAIPFWLPSLLVMCLLLLKPGVAQAAADAPLLASTLRGTAPAPTSLRLSQQSQEEKPGTFLRLAAEVGGGLVGATLLGFGGLLAGGGVCEVLDLGDPDAFAPCLGVGIIGAVLGISAGMPLGVWGAGNLAGGNGSLLAAFAGSAAGLLLSVGALYIDEDIGFIPVPFLTLAGAMLGYELTHGPESPAQASTGVHLQPLLGFSSRGAVLGLGGSF